jgi:Domain of unknown function (DUF3854)
VHNQKSYTQSQHINEFNASALDPDIQQLNFSSVGQESAFSFLVRNPDRRNDGRLTDRYLRTFDSLDGGGWICTGIDPLTMDLSEWGCLKPNVPRWDEQEQKSIKYEHPHGFPTELFCLRVTYGIGFKIARNNGILAEAGYLARMVDVDCSDEDRGFWQWVLDNPQLKIIITEGTKKAASLLSAGYLAIGLPGIWAGFRSKINRVDCIPFLIPQLKIFCQEGREFVFCFDNDTKPTTIANVHKAIAKTGKLLQHKGCSVSVIQWIHPYKGVDDLIFNLEVDYLTNAFNDRQSLDKWRLDKTFGTSQLPQTRINSRYLDDFAPKPDSVAGRIIAVKSAKGTGKTKSYIASLITPEMERGRRILVITHRIQLAKALAADLGLNHISEVRGSETGSLFGYSLCVDSLHSRSQARFNPNDWEGAIVVLDECEQVIQHMLNSPTCQQNRVAILQTFEQLMRVVGESEGTVILADADLSRASINYIENLTENRLSLWLLINTYKLVVDARNLFTYSSNPKLFSAFCEAVAFGKKVIIHCSAQKAKSKYGTINLETMLRTRFPDSRILRIDSETVSDRTHSAYGCIENINEVLVNYDIVIASPTVETGISIDGNHFDSVWALVNGIQTVDAVCQTLSRVRSDVPRHISIIPKVLNKIGNGSDSIPSLLHTEHQLFKANAGALAMVDAIAAANGYSKAHFDTWAAYAAKTNQGFNNYKQNILDKLTDEGYKISAYSPSDPTDPTEKIEAELASARSINYEAERTAKIESPNPNDDEFASLKKKIAKTKAERILEAKGSLVRRYLTEDITDDMIIKDEKGWYPQLQLHYYLTIGRLHLKERDVRRVSGLDPNGGAFKPDLNKITLSTKIKTLEILEIEQFFDPEKIFTNETLAPWHENMLKYLFNINQILPITISRKATPIKAAQQLLGMMGLKLTLLQRIRIKGVITRQYAGVDCDADERLVVLNRWLERDERIEVCDTELYRSIVNEVSVTATSGTESVSQQQPQTPLTEVVMRVGDCVRIKSTGQIGTLSIWHRLKKKVSVELPDEILTDFIYVSDLELVVPDTKVAA